MKKDDFKTDVIFRIAKRNKTPFAFFPYVISDYKGNITAYAHIGQHSGACWEYFPQNTVPAKEIDYMPLKRELESIGYNLNIIKKRNYTRYLTELRKAR